MIFATVGTQLPFVRLAQYLDTIALERDEPIIFQSADADWNSNVLEVQAFMKPAVFEETFAKARIIVGHAGIGTILTARRLQKPLIIVPRQFALGEHRNDHQLATAAQLSDAPDIAIAANLENLRAAIASPPRLQTNYQPLERSNLVRFVASFLAD